jgi:hypothetical protein
MTKPKIFSALLLFCLLVSCGDVGTSTLTEPTNDSQPSTGQTSQESKPKTDAYGEGTYEVGKDIKAGKYRTKGSKEGCYYERLRDLDGSAESIIKNEMIEGPSIMTVNKSDKYITLTGECEWAKQ